MRFTVMTFLPIFHLLLQLEDVLICNTWVVPLNRLYLRSLMLVRWYLFIFVDKCSKLMVLILFDNLVVSSKWKNDVFLPLVIGSYALMITGLLMILNKLLGYISTVIATSIHYLFLVIVLLWLNVVFALGQLSFLLFLAKLRYHQLILQTLLRNLLLLVWWLRKLLHILYNGLFRMNL